LCLACACVCGLFLEAASGEHRASDRMQ
jgi:hypothetical protein